MYTYLKFKTTLKSLKLAIIDKTVWTYDILDSM